MKRFVVAILAVVGGLVLVTVFLAGGVGLVVAAGKGRVPGKTILEADFEKGLVEYVPEDPVARLVRGKTATTLDVVEALERAGNDDRVVAFVARLGQQTMGVAQDQEIRDAVTAFRKKGKKAIAFSETFGEFGPGNGSYYLATAFDEIWLQPSGDVGLNGLMLESPFLKGTLEKMGVTPRMDQRYEYKTAMNLFTEKKYTEAHRESNKKVMDSIFGQLVKGIAEGRKLPEAEVRALIDRGPFLGKEAVDAKLVDGVAYRDEVYAKVKEKAPKGARFLRLATYLERAGGVYDKGTTVALIYGVGGVQRGKSEYNPVTGGQSMGSDTVAAAFRSAVEDKSVKAILFRVDSPGGSYVASDTIWRETLRAKKAGKPVVVSMGNVAGSGGYFVAMGCDKIVAQPGTITASIGVLAGKMLTSGMWEKVGLSWDEIHTSANATMFTGTHDYTPAEWAKFQAWLDRIYVDFTSKVAEGRNLPKEKVLQIARGRIWTGEDAKGLGLIDEVGGFPAALRLVRQAAKLPENARLKLEAFPRPKSPFERFMERGESSETSAAAAILVRTLEAVQPFGRLVRASGLAGTRGVLEMEDPEPIR